MKKITNRISRKQLIKQAQEAITRAAKQTQVQGQIAIGVNEKLWQLFTGQKLPEGMFKRALQAAYTAAEAHKGPEPLNLNPIVEAAFHAPSDAAPVGEV